MKLAEDDLLLVTGATGLVGSHVAERAAQLGMRTRVIVRPGSESPQFESWGVETVSGDITDQDSLAVAVSGVTTVVHCAAKVGDWGPVEDYRAVNVRGLENLLSAVESESNFKKFVQISSLGVYEARDHYGTDECEPLNSGGIDGYTLTKIEAEQLLDVWLQERDFPAVVLRPGFIYGPRDRTVLPRIFQRLKVKGVKYLGSGRQLMNNTYVGNLVDAVFLALENDQAIGEKYNITDGRLVSKREFMTTIAQASGYEIPQGAVALPVARVLAKLMEGAWKILGKKEAPLLSNARIKFMGLNLDFSIEKAKLGLGYQPAVDFTQGMQNTVEWFRKQGFLPKSN